MLKLKRIVQTYLGLAPRGLESFVAAARLWLTDRAHGERRLRQLLGYQGPILHPQHHDSHSASAFYPSPYDEAAILTMDGVGEWATTSWGTGRGSEITILRELRWPDSLGLLYSAFTAFSGFKIDSGEYKVMGLAPYGEPKYAQLILDELMDLKEDGSFRLNQKYFNYLTGMSMTNQAFADLFGGPPRVPESKLTQREMDLARSVQHVTEEVMLRMARTVQRETGMENLVHGRRRRAQLRRQRPRAARRSVQAHLDPTRRRRRGRGARRGVARLASAPPATPRRELQRFHEGLLPWAVLLRRCRSGRSSNRPARTTGNSIGRPCSARSPRCWPMAPLSAGTMAEWSSVPVR